jgi:4-amino-4-deoxy-L-arabinose transferase-like glycosyltransferase
MNVAQVRWPEAINFMAEDNLASTLEQTEPRLERMAPVGVLTRARERLSSLDVAQQVLLVILLIYVAKQAATVAIFPPFSGHDELAHYAYIQTVATEHRVPIIPDLEELRVAVAAQQKDLPGDYFPDELYKYCRYALDWDWCNESRWKDNPVHAVTASGEVWPWGWQYVANHPPLYHILMAPVYWATDNQSPAFQQYALRAAAIPIGIFIVVLAYLLATILFPGDLFLAISVPAFVAFQPQISYEAAMVNNDILGIAMVSLMLYLTVRGLRDRFPWRLTVLLGVVLGLGLLTKSTTVVAIPGLLLALIFGLGWRNVRAWMPRGGAIAAVGALVASPWYIFLWRTYGNLSGLDQIAALQWRWTYRDGDAPSIFAELFNVDFAGMRWRETWGEFGWRLIHLDTWLLIVIGIPCLIALAGLGYYGWVAWRRASKAPEKYAAIYRPTTWQIVALLVLLLTCAIAYGAVLQFGLRFRLTQARYFFPAINAAALLLMLGLRALVPERALRYAPFVLIASLVVLNGIIYAGYVIPYDY